MPAIPIVQHNVKTVPYFGTDDSYKVAARSGGLYYQFFNMIKHTKCPIHIE